MSNYGRTLRIPPSTFRRGRWRITRPCSSPGGVSASRPRGVLLAAWLARLRAARPGNSRAGRQAADDGLPMTHMTKWLGGLSLWIVVGGPISPTVAQDCTAAGTAVQIQAEVTGTDTLTVRYTVVNHSADSLRWIRIGAGRDQDRTVAVPGQILAIAGTPRGWRGVVVYPEETAYIHLWWEGATADVQIGPGRSADGFAIRVLNPTLPRPNLVGPYGRAHPIDFGTLPFAVGTHEGCWWGHVRNGP